MRTRSDRLVAVATLGAFVVVAGILGLVSLYLGAVTQALSGVQRTASLPEYDGRPLEQPAEGNRPMRYLVLVTDEHRGLASAYLVQLSGGRDALHLIGLPANLLVADATGAESTLAGQFTAGTDHAVRAVEKLLAVRLDHLVQVDLPGFTRIVDVLGGVTVDNRMEMSADGLHFPKGDLALNGTQARIYLSASKHAMPRLQRTEAVFVQILRGMIGGDALTNPAKVESIGEVLQHCVTVDAALTPGEIRRMALDMRISPDAVGGSPLPLAGISEWRGDDVVVPDRDAVQALTAALLADQLAAWSSGRGDPWAELQRLPPR